MNDKLTLLDYKGFAGKEIDIYSKIHKKINRKQRFKR